MTDKKIAEFQGTTNPKKLAYLLGKLKEKNITTPKHGNVVSIFEESGWKISSAQAWQYKRKAEEEIRRQQRAQDPTTQAAQ